MPDDLNEKIGRLLERTEIQGEQLERLLREGSQRDATRREESLLAAASLQAVKTEVTETLSQKVREGVHDQLGALQPLISRLDQRLRKIEDRVEGLEEPVNRAMRRSLKRRKIWMKVTAWASFVGISVWALAEPIWKAVAEPIAKILMRRWLGSDS